MLVAPHGTIEAMLQQQGEALMRRVTPARPPISGQSATGHALLAAANQIAALETGSERETILGEPARIWFSWRLMSRGAPWLAERLSQPLLVVAGDEDQNVGLDQFEAWQRTLTSRGQTQHEFERVPCMSHALNCVTRELQAAPARERVRVGATLAPGLSERIVAFIRR
jgi:fermentation-respiration switch protein FrsA (DUF1100 family)